jgi:hypothetical protein
VIVCSAWLEACWELVRRIDAFKDVKGLEVSCSYKQTVVRTYTFSVTWFTPDDLVFCGLAVKWQGLWPPAPWPFQIHGAVKKALKTHDIVWIGEHSDKTV